MERFSKKAIKAAIKAAVLPIAIIAGIGIGIAILLGAAYYFLTVDDGTYKEGDWSNAPYVAQQYSNGMQLTKDGYLAADKSLNELWADMVKGHSRVPLYLNGPKEYLQMMYAQMVTQLPDLREDTSKIRGMDEWKELFDNLKEEEGKFETFHGSVGSSSSGSGDFDKYDLSDTEVRGLTAVALQEQGSVQGAAAEASLMANLYEERGSSFSGIVDYVLHGGWFAEASTSKYSGGTTNEEAVSAVKSVLVEGKRTLPKYVNEHDYRGDIISVTNDGTEIDKNDNSAYIQHKTIIKNSMGSTYTFYSFPAEGSDPFGYTSTEAREQYGDDCYGESSSSSSTIEKSGYKTNIQGGIVRFARNLVTGETEVTDEELEKMEYDYQNYKDDYEAQQKEKEKREKRKAAEEEEKKNEEQKRQEVADFNLNDKTQYPDGNPTEKEEETEETQETEDEEEVEPLLEFEEWMKQKGYTKQSNGKWKRNGHKISMTYVSPDKFEEYINAYKNAKNEEERIKARDEAMSHFTLEKGGSVNGNSNSDSSLGEAISEEEIGSALANAPDCTYEDLVKLANDIYGMSQECFDIVLGWAAGEAYDALGEEYQYLGYLCDCIGINRYAGEGHTTAEALARSIGGRDTSGYYSVSQMSARAKNAGQDTLKSMYVALKNPDERPFGCEGVSNYSDRSPIYTKYLSNSNFTGNINVWPYQPPISWKYKYKTSDVPTIGSMDGVLFVGDSITEGLRQEVEDNKTYTLSSETKDALKNCLFRSEVSTRPSDWLKRIKSGGVFPNNSEVNAVCVMLGTNGPTEQSQMQQLIDELCKKYSGKKIYVQKLLPRGRNSTGFYFGPEEHNELMKKYNEDIEQYCNSKDNVYFIDATSGYVLSDGYLDSAKSSDGCHLDKDREKWAQNIINIITGGSSNSSSSSSSSSSEFSSGSLVMNKDALDNDPDFSNNEAWKAPNNPYAPSLYGQCTWFAWGKFYEIYGFSPGFTGNGYECAKQLVSAHPDKFEMSSSPATGSVFSYNNHVGLVTRVDGDSITIQDGNYNYMTDTWEVAITDWKKYDTTFSDFKARHPDVEFAIPIGATTSNGSNSKSGGATYNVKIATWEEVTTSYTTNDPNDSNGGSEPRRTTYKINTETINYYDMVKAYTMPFDYLWALMTITEDRGFVFELLRTIYESDIEITVNDTITDTEVITDNTYIITETATASGNVAVRYWKNLSKEDVEASKQREQATLKTQESIKDLVVYDQSFATQRYVRTITNSVEAALTRANVWIVDYTKDFIYKEEHIGPSSVSSNLDTINETRPLQESDIQVLKDNATSKVDGEVITVVANVKGQRNWSKHDRVETITTTTHIQGYEEGEKSLREKTGKALKQKKTKKSKVKFIEITGEVDIFEDLDDSKYDEISEDEIDTSTTIVKDSERSEKEKEAEEKEKDKEETEENKKKNDEEEENKEKDKESEDKKEEENKNEDNVSTIENSTGNLVTQFATNESFRYREKNFVTLLCTYSKARTNILNVASWLFEILEANESTVEMIDLTKYLLYKVTDDEKWGVLEFDFSIFDPDNFQDAEGLCGGTPEEQVWYALRKAGYSEEATAGAMGNIYCESGFKFDAVEQGPPYEGHGLIQWSFERKENLFAKAKSMGKEWSDPDVQIEYLLDELKEGGPYDTVGMNGCSRSSWVKSKTPEDGAYQFEWWFERHAGGTQPLRAQKAREYYDQFHGRPLSSFENARKSGDVIAACKSVMEDMKKRHVVYSVSPAHLTWGNIKKSAQDPYACCATYVSAVLYKAGLLTESQINAYNYHYTGPGGVADMLLAAGWKKIPTSQAKEGDVVNMNCYHVMFYGGGNLIWDENCAVITKRGGPTGGPMALWDVYKAERGSNLSVYRAP